MLTPRQYHCIYAVDTVMVILLKRLYIACEDISRNPSFPQPAEVIKFLDIHLKTNVLFCSLDNVTIFQCGSQEAGLVKYDKYTCKK